MDNNLIKTSYSIKTKMRVTKIEKIEISVIIDITINKINLFINL